MESAANSRPDLAAALFRLIGASILVNYTEGEEAQRLYAKPQDDHERLSRVIFLCGTPKMPQQLYIVATVCSWLGGNDELTAKYAWQHLEVSGWDHLSYGTMIQSGVTTSRWAGNRAKIYVILTQAQENLGKHGAVLINLAKVCRLEPYDTIYAVEVAGVIEHARGRKEVLQFLEQQTLTPHYRPLHYKDEHGNRGSDQTFRQIIDSYILEFKSKED